MKFAKMQGCGNDYVYVDCFRESVTDPHELARRVSDRRFGIGSDGLILIKPSEKADFTMEMYNADGSQGQMCGNAIRCVGKYVYDHGMTDRTELAIETLAGVKYLQLSVKGRETFPVPDECGCRKQGEEAVSGEKEAGEKEAAGKTEIGKSQESMGNTRKRGSVSEVTVDMGVPGLRPADLPVEADGEKVIDEPIMVGGREFRMTAVSMGNPHAVVFVDDTAGFPVDEIGPLFENHKRFPERVNTEFVQILNRGAVNMRVWERGSAETWACGTGACASVMACILNGLTEDEVTVHMLGGDLRIRYDRGSGRVFMTGPAVTVFEGETRDF